ncbi:hypothetical protein IV02_07750 [Pseudomonas syringae]|uniref:Uncharacterized protein n=1 Tax=Pseudomonas syringae TaxID=317 RepID=A0A085VA68_PSESX|nr:hypothetical protein IV02_07750 [Pseudomonas syringae]
MTAIEDKSSPIKQNITLCFCFKIYLKPRQSLLRTRTISRQALRVFQSGIALTFNNKAHGIHGG